MKRYAVLPVICVMFALFTSCNDRGNIFTASGTTSEVIVIMDDSAWEAAAGRALFNVLNSNVKAIPQAEPNFRIMQLNPEHFSGTFKMARNIVIPNISEIYSFPKLSSDIDKFAMGQIILNINAPDTASFIEYVTKNKENIVDYLVTKELERNARFLKNESGQLSRIKQVFDFNIHFPKGLTNIIEHPNFYWATNNATRGRKDIVIYQFPYTTETVFEKDSLIAIRNRVLGENITGQFESKMTTAVRSYTPDFRKIEVDGIFRAELRGLWEMSTDMMGGPFVMHAFVNENTNMVVVVEAFVYAPEMNKRNLIRNLESVLYTISIPGREEENTEK